MSEATRNVEAWLWEAACQIRGPVDAPKFKDYILPLVFLKHLSDVFEDEVCYLAQELGSDIKAAEIVEEDHSMVRFYIPEHARWPAIASRSTMLASLGAGGRMAVVLDTGAVSRGSGNQGSNRERDIRRAFVERDLIEAVLLLPENLFYNTTAPGIVLVVNKQKRRPSEVLLINASSQFAKGRPKNYLKEEHIAAVHRCYSEWEAVEGLSAIISQEELARNDFNLSPSRYVATGAEQEVLPLEEALVLLQEAEEERAAADAELVKVLKELGLGNADDKT